MQYDIASKEFMQISGHEILQKFLQVRPSAIQTLDELPTETVNVRRSDAPVRMTLASGEERVVLVEYQTNWETGLPMRLVEYHARYWLRYRLPVDALVFLIRPHAGARDVYADHALRFRYHLVKLWELPAADYIDAGVSILPFIPLMQDGDQYVERARQRIQNEDNLSPDEKTSLLSVLYIYTGIHDPERAREIMRQAGPLMFESPVYDWIRQEGIEEGREEGIAEGKLDTARRLLELGIDPATVIEATGLSAELLRERGVLEDA